MFKMDGMTGRAWIPGLLFLSTFAGGQTVLHGRVEDAAGHAVAGARVHTQGSAASVMTDSAGVFQVEAPATQQYEVTAETTDGLRGQATVADAATVLRVVVRPALETLKFSDQPNFTVAGITDWTAVGGHGSDSTLRTSEDLARAAAKTGRAGPAGGPARVAELQQAIASAQAGGRAAQAHRLQGELDEALGDPLGAVREEAEAVRLDPDEENYLAWGSELLLHRAILQAADVFSQGLLRLPASTKLRTGFGAALFAEAKYDQAAAELCRASDAQPENKETLRMLGKVGIAAPVPTPCVEARLRRFLQHAPDDAEANYFEAMVLLRTPGDKDQANRDQTNKDHAKKLLHTAVSQDPALADAWLQLGILEAASHEDVAAEKDFRAALLAEPSMTEAHFRLAVLLERTGKTEEAKREFSLHQELMAEDAARVERERRAVKEFVIAAGK